MNSIVHILIAKKKNCSQGNHEQNTHICEHFILSNWPNLLFRQKEKQIYNNIFAAWKTHIQMVMITCEREMTHDFKWLTNCRQRLIDFLGKLVFLTPWPKTMYSYIIILTQNNVWFVSPKCTRIIKKKTIIIRFDKLWLKIYKKRGIKYKLKKIISIIKISNEP